MKVLLVVDIQNDFLPGGALAVPEGDKIIALANELMEKFDFVVATQDWHPAHHGSFAVNHKNKEPGNIIELNGLEQILWPVHCVQNSHGAKFADGLHIDRIKKIFQKGTDPDIDSYSGFFDNGHLKSTGLGEYLHDLGIKEVYLVGLATDYCVKFSAFDSIKSGFKTFLFPEATRAVNLQRDDYEKSLAKMSEAGVQMVSASDI